MAGKPAAPIVAVLGARGTGKSAWLTQELRRAKPARLVVWDLMQDDCFAPLGPGLSMAQAIRAMGAARWQLRVWPDRSRPLEPQFDRLCRVLLHVGRCTLVAEELAFVTKSGKAPPAWRELCLLGRHAGVSIIGTSQRPADVDKSFLGNLDLLHAGRQTSERDAKTVAALLAVPWREVMSLPNLEWFERAAGEVQARRGVLKFSAARPARRQKSSGTGPQGEDSTTGE